MSVAGHVNFVGKWTGLGMKLTCKASTAFMPATAAVQLDTHRSIASHEVS